jgi:hypothetical protein
MAEMYAKPLQVGQQKGQGPFSAGLHLKVLQSLTSELALRLYGLQETNE